MKYDFVLSIGDLAADGPTIDATDWQAYPLLERSDWSVDPGTITTRPTGIHVVVETDNSIEPEQAFSIGCELHSTLFDGANVQSLMYREVGPVGPLGAAPGEVRVCLRCGGLDGDHNPSCAGRS